MDAGVRKANPVVANEAGQRRVGNTRDLVDIWLDANIKILDEIEYQRYRRYLVADQDVERVVDRPA